MMEAWLGLIGAITGVVVTWILNETTKALKDRQQNDKVLQMAAFVCLDRLLKIRSASVRSDAPQQDGELKHLGTDLDAYRDRIAASSKPKRASHWEVYKRMMPILLEHDMSQLDSIITELEDLANT
jgi:hypothetical protein